MNAVQIEVQGGDVAISPATATTYQSTLHKMLFSGESLHFEDSLVNSSSWTDSYHGICRGGVYQVMVKDRRRGSSRPTFDFHMLRREPLV